jgi:hypothetical protein
MKKINIEVKVKYKVGLGDLEVPKKIKAKLDNLYDSGRELSSDSLEDVEVVEWLRSNIKERDCFECVYEVHDLSL